jgi:dCTP deaminase
MMLAHLDLKRAWKAKQIRFEPDISEEQISLSSIDLRLGRNFATLKSQAKPVRPTQDFDPSVLVENTNLSSGKYFRFPPQEFCLAQTLEKITLPTSLAAHIHGRSSLARSGLVVHATAPHIHPGFYGPITLELFNYGPWELEFLPGTDIICQLILWEVKTPPPGAMIKRLSGYRGQKIPFPKKRPNEAE